MGNLTSCLRKAGSALADSDRKFLLRRSREARKQGLPTKTAAIQAIDELLAKAEQQRKDADRAMVEAPRPETRRGSSARDKTGEEFDMRVREETLGANKDERAVIVEAVDPASGLRRGLVDFAVRADGVLVAENAKVAPAFKGRGIAELMYRAAREAGYDIAPGRVQTDEGQRMVESFQKKGLINKEAEGKRFRAGDLDLVPIEGESIPGEKVTRASTQRENNASGESAASLEAQGRVAQESEREQTRILVNRDGTIRPLVGVDAVDQRAGPGQMVLQRNVGRNAWTVLEEGADVTKSMRARALAKAADYRKASTKRLDVRGLAKIEKNLTPAERGKLNQRTAERLVEQFKQLPPTDEFAAAAFAGKAKRGWYKESARAIAQVFGHDGPRFAALLAAMSPQNSVQTNLLNTLNTWKNWTAAGRPTDRESIIDIMGQSVEGKRGRESVLDAWINNSVRALAGENPGEDLLSGPKVNSFMRNLLGDVQEVTNDAWMANFALVDQQMFSGKLTKTDSGKGTGYLAMNAKVRAAAARLTELTGETWTPAEVQETVWSWAKTLYEAQVEGATARDILYNEELTDDMIRSTPDFKGLFHDDKYAAILRDAGYGDELDRLDRGGAGQQGSEAGGQAEPFASDTQARLLDSAAGRLERLKAEGKPGERQESTRREGQLDNVEAYHYSTAPRERLSSSSFGTGLKGSGREEYQGAADPRRRQRIYFYVDKGTGVRPEAGVGSYPHKASLDNVYDINADPLKLKKGTQAATETAVLDAGFDGYLDRLEGTQPGQVIMLGQRSIPVEALEPGPIKSGVVSAPLARKPATWATYSEGPEDRIRRQADTMRSRPSWAGYDIRVVLGANGQATLETREKAAAEKVVVNIGLNVPDGSTITADEAIRALEAEGATILATEQRQSNTEPTLIATLAAPLTKEQGDRISTALRQEAIAQLAGDRGDLFGPQAEAWSPFNPEFFLKPTEARAASARRDLFPEDFAEEGSTVPTNRVISSKGETSEGGNTDSTGRQISSTKQGLANFWKWFGGSDAVDADGRPLVLYHSTNSDVGAFETGRPTSNNYGFLGNVDTTRAGIFLSPDREFSQEYLRSGPGQNVMPTYAKIENPLDLRSGLSETDEAALSEAGVNTRAIINTQNTWELFDDEFGADLVASLQKAGYDGAVMREQSPGGESSGGVTYVAFRPAQIKSAIGNRGTFDPANPDIRASQRRAAPAQPPQAPYAWNVDAPGKMDDFIRTMQDKQIDTKRIVAAVKEQVRDLGDKWNPYLQEELFHGRAAKKTTDFLDFELRPLLQEMQARGVKLDEFEAFLHNRHAEERNQQIASINPAMPDGGSGIKTADARAYLAQLPAERRRAYEALAKRVDEINQKTQELLVDSGLEDATTIAKWNDTYQHYVPLQREEFEEDTAQGTGQGMSVKGGASRRAMGSELGVANILANIASARERTITRAEKNRVATALYGMAIQAPKKGFWKAFAPKRFESQAKLEQEMLDLGMAPPDAANIAAEPEQRYVDPRTGLVVSRVNPLLRSAPNVLALRVNGEDRFVMFNERDERANRAVRSLKNLDADQLGRVLSVTAKISRYFASINTQWNPVFGVVNLLRDTQGALLNLSTTPLADRKGAVLKEAGSALLGIYSDIRAHRKGRQPQSQWAQLWEEFQREGGQTGYRDMYANPKERSEAIQDELAKITEGKAKQAGRAIFDWLKDYNDTMENAVRLSAYKAGKDKGLTNQQAASIAKNLTVNFNRKGDVAQQAGALYAFFNASAQGTARLAETLRGPMGKKIVAGALLLGVAQAFMLAAAGFDDEEPPDFLKDRALILPIGDGKFLSVPMPLGLHVLPSTARRITEWMMSGGRDTGRRLAEMAGLYADAFNPIGNAGLSLQTIAPTAVDPLAALTENRDFAGRPIAREDMNGLKPTPGFTRSKDAASGVGKAVSYYLNLLSGGTEYKPGAFSPTPDQIDYLIGQVTGGLGRELLKATTTARAAATGEELPTYKIPLLGRFYGDTTGQASQAAKFYSNVKKLNEHALELEGRRKHGEGATLREYIRDNPEAILAKQAEKAQRDLSEAKATKRRLIEKNASPETVAGVETRITGIMARLNRQVERLRSKGGAQQQAAEVGEGDGDQGEE